MGHFKTKNTRAENTHPSWLKTGSQIGQLVNEWARRSDLVVYVGPGAGGPAPAAYSPAMSEIEVNTDAAFGAGIEPQIIGDLRDRDVQFDWPKASGAIFHEACHARYSMWSMEKAYEALTTPEFEALTLLEEGRIEAFGVRETKENREFLRSCALEIVLGDLTEEGLSELSNIHAGARLAGLTLARVDAGVLDHDDLGDVPSLLESLLGAELIETLRGLWLEAQEHGRHYDATPMYDIAKRWVAAVSKAQEENGEEPGSEGPGENSTECEFPGAGAGSGKGGELSDKVKEILKALAEAADIASIEAAEGLADQQTSEAWAATAKSRGNNAAEMNKHKKAAEKVFIENVPGAEGAATRSRLVESRQPSAKERAAAVKLGQLLDKAKYRERSQTEIKSATPPGRLRTTALVQGAAIKAKGLMAQTEPWRRTQRKHTDNPQLKVGVMVDISGSMGSAMEPMAITAWVLSEATKRVQGKAAMVYYGSSVFPTLKPGQHLPEVQIYSAPDGTEKFDDAFKAMDGAMNFLHGDGARLLVIVSDGHYTHPEREAAQMWIERSHKAGVGVLWLTFDDVYAARGLVKDNGEVVVVGRDTTEAVSRVGMAAVKVLTAAGNRR